MYSLQKEAVQCFAEILIPYLGIEGKVVGNAPTELVQLELHKMYQDYNLIMEDGNWKHFEFQSTNEGLKGLKRFRVYEANASYQHGVEVETYVLYSGNIVHPMTEFTEGVNTYRIIPIIMRDRDGDVLIKKLLEKLEDEENLTKEDIVPLVLLPLMKSEKSQKERIKVAFELIGKASDVAREDIRKIEAMVYAMADKFLDAEELKELEWIKMTRLGAMLVNDGIEQGKILGIEIGEQRGIEIGEQRGIKNMVNLCQEFGMLKEDIVDKIVSKYGRERTEAEKDVEKYWN